MKRSEIIFGALRLPIDYIAALGAFMLAYFLRPITDLIPGVQYTFLPEQLPPVTDYTKLAIFSAGFLVLLFAGNNLYSLKITHHFTQEMFKIIFMTSAWLMFIIAYYFLVVHELFFSRIALAHIWLFTNFFVIIGRLAILIIQSMVLRLGIGKRRILFVGIGDLADQFYETLKNDPRYQVIGALFSKRQSRKQGKLKIIGTFDQLGPVVKRWGVEEIIQADPDAQNTISQELHAFCRANQIRYHFIPDLVRLQRTNVDIEMIGQVPLISLKQTPLDGWGHIFKQAFDTMFSLVFIVLLIPVWVLMALAIKIDSHGPVIYKSRRQYRNKTFNVYKFRTMGEDADFKKKKLLEKSDREGPLFKMEDDPRVTRLGRFLRKTSLDELPQLFNVLIGNMSLVGPRPHLPEEVEKYASHHHQVFAIKPGLTGLAQVSGRSHLSFEKEVQLDVYYIENWSLWLDIKLILKSVGIIFRADGT
ncbi:MAG: sugar transferase [Candidatus Peregrinibacteria bacterium]